MIIWKYTSTFVNQAVWLDSQCISTVWWMKDDMFFIKKNQWYHFWKVTHNLNVYLYLLCPHVFVIGQRHQQSTRFRQNLLSISFETKLLSSIQCCRCFQVRRFYYKTNSFCCANETMPFTSNDVLVQLYCLLTQLILPNSQPMCAI